MNLEEIEKAESILLAALAEKNLSNVLIQPWQDGFLIHTYDEYGHHKNTVGAQNLYDALNKL